MRASNIVVRTAKPIKFEVEVFCAREALRMMFMSDASRAAQLFALFSESGLQA
jgi:hypothetical protein